MIKHQIDIAKIMPIADNVLSSKNWFKRQSLYKMINDLIK